ncbi:hypothetical protein HYQ45_003108 [Verticillium longisporum]|uniref:Uncharacterized protein n=1 Tax=Verticillium longisporum TaxID=100787 RepID=A0A8I2ZW70_VERLO|nr:hypothetical protein HYQ45_003108 [Verticillium longisporum]
MWQQKVAASYFHAVSSYSAASNVLCTACFASGLEDASVLAPKIYARLGVMAAMSDTGTLRKSVLRQMEIIIAFHKKIAAFNN